MSRQNIFLVIMAKRRQNTQMVEFSNLTEDHKAEFLQFLIKNNICFQQGKQNCIAKISIKNHKQNNPKEHNQRDRNPKQQIKKEQKRDKTPILKPKKLKQQPNNRQNILEPTTPNRQTQHQQLFASSLSCKKQSGSTIKKNRQKTPVKSRGNVQDCRSLSEHHKVVTASSGNGVKIDENQRSKRIKKEKQIEKQKERDIQRLRERQNDRDKEHTLAFSKPNLKKLQKSREKVVNKYAIVFDIDTSRQRPIRWPINLLEKTIQEIYEQIFARNSQYLQNKNMSTAMKALTLNQFPQLISSYFKKKFKGKLVVGNLTNMLYSLSYFISRQNCPIFLKTFENFLLKQYQYEDLVFYLFARNILKRQIRANEKNRELRSQGMVGQFIKVRQINKFLKGIVGKDIDLLRQYRQIVFGAMENEQIEVYEFLKIILEDYNKKRAYNSEIQQNYDSFGNTLAQKDFSYQRKNTEQLTFGEQPQEQQSQPKQFWKCLEYSRLSDQLFDFIHEKMEKKVTELIQILSIDMDEHKRQQIWRLQGLLLHKSQSLAKATFQMNKMKWFRQLGIDAPSQHDMEMVEKIQMKLRQLRVNPSGREIGQFCKSILTTKQLVNQLERSLL